MGTHPGSTTTGRRQPRRTASFAIAALAVTGILSACTAATVGAARPTPAPGIYPTGAGAAVKVTTSPETQESLRMEHRAIKVAKPTKALSEFEQLRREHQLFHGK